jgi:hypothetical protein
VSRRETFGSKIRNAIYKIEAPLNDAGRMIFAEFQLGSTALEELPKDEEWPVSPFDPNSIEDYEVAFCDFLIQRAIEKFMAPMLQGWGFSTVTSEVGL